MESVMARFQKCLKTLIKALAPDPDDVMASTTLADMLNLTGPLPRSPAAKLGVIPFIKGPRVGPSLLEPGLKPPVLPVTVGVLRLPVVGVVVDGLLTAMRQRLLVVVVRGLTVRGEPLLRGSVDTA